MNFQNLLLKEKLNIINQPIRFQKKKETGRLSEINN